MAQKQRAQIQFAEKVKLTRKECIRKILEAFA